MTDQGVNRLAAQVVPVDPVGEKKEPPVDRRAIHLDLVPPLELMDQAEMVPQRRATKCFPACEPQDPCLEQFGDPVMPGQEIHDPERRFQLLPREGR